MNITLKQASYAVLITIIVLGAVYSVYNFGGQNQPPLPPKNYKIGFLLTDKDIGSANIAGFKAGMEAAGYKEGVNVTYIEKNAGADKAAVLDGYAKELNDMGLDIILTGSTSATLSLKKLDLKTPVFFLAAGIPSQLVKNPQKPEGMITGLGEPSAEFAGRRLEILKQMVPSIKKVISIVETNYPTAEIFRTKLNEAAPVLGIEMIYIEINRDKIDEILSKLPLLKKSLGDAYIACTCRSNEKYSKELSAALLKAKLPSINPETEIGAKIGWLASHSNDRYKNGIQATSKVIRLLNGEAVSNIPVEYVTDLILELNLATAKAIGVTLPETIISRANKIYNE